MNERADDVTWLLPVRQNALRFLERLRGTRTSGFFHYTFSGDLFGEEELWGLGNTTFAIKLYYTLGLMPTLTELEKHALYSFIERFRTANGYLSDPLVARLTWWRDKLFSIRHADFNNFWHQQTIRAETRQALSSLQLLGYKIDTSELQFPKTEPDIQTYLENLDWTRPWGAGSHFSHLIFFLHHSRLPNKDDLIQQARQWLAAVHHSYDGAWYKGEPTVQQKINGAMKIITAFKLLNLPELNYIEQLIDLCLAAEHDLHACDNFNIIYVLSYAHRLAPQYRPDEVAAFAWRRLAIYRNYYYPTYGGFSFSLHKASSIYYGARISKGLDEPDIHGTTMFLWGISIISQLLPLNQQLELQEFIP